MRSRAVFEAPTTAPVASKIGESEIDTEILVPSLRRRTVSNCSTRWPEADECEKGFLFGAPLEGDNQDDRLPDGLGRRVSEEALGTFVPARDDPVEPLAHDSVVRRLHDRRQERTRLFRFVARCDVIDHRNSRAAAVEGEPSRGKLGEERRAVLAPAKHGPSVLAISHSGQRCPDGTNVTVGAKVGDLEAQKFVL